MEFPVPAGLRAQHRLHVFPRGYGYDGQFYHLMAHDPLAQGDSWRYMDDPRLRYRRILVPMSAALLVLGGRLVDAAYDAVLLAAVALGAWAFGAAARARGRSAAWGALFLVVPAAAISLDRMTPDVALASLTAALAVAVETERRGLALAASMMAPLVRETGWLLLLGYGASVALRRDWRQAGHVALAALPALGWYTYVHLLLPAQPYPLLPVPLSGLWSAAVHPPDASSQERLAPLMRASGLLALAGIVAAWGFAIALFRRDPRGALPMAALLFAATGIFVQRPDHWHSAHDYARVYSPLLAILALQFLTRGAAWPLLPLALVWPRLALEMRGEILGVARGIL